MAAVHLPPRDPVGEREPAPGGVVICLARRVNDLRMKSPQVGLLDGIFTVQKPGDLKEPARCVLTADLDFQAEAVPFLLQALVGRR